MAYTLQDFCAEIHGILIDDDGPGGREQVRQRMETLLANEAFVEQFCGPDKPAGTFRLNEDPTTGAVVLAHINDLGHASPPHDHGASWAVYGQAAKHTVMTEWERTDDGTDPGAVALRKRREYRLDPGEAGLFDVGQIHAIDYPDGARFIRVTGVDLETIERRAYNLERGTEKIIRSEAAVAD